MNEGDEAQSAPVGHYSLFEIGQREAVDYHRDTVGKFGQQGCVIVRDKLDDPYGAPAGPQTLDDVAIVKVAAGKLVEPARDDKAELAHPSGAS